MTSDPEVYERLKFLQNAIGAVPSPMDCYLVLRGTKTLALRMERHSQNALSIATWLESHPWSSGSSIPVCPATRSMPWAAGSIAVPAA